MKVVIVGAGIGGLACAIACRQQNLDVTVLEQASEILPVGAGIQVPPNAARIMRELGLLPQLLEKGTVIEATDLRRYKDSSLITSMPVGEKVESQYGAPWLVIHRADYHEILLTRAKSLGVEIRLNAGVEWVDFETTEAVLTGGDRVAGDVIIGADGIWSTVRNAICDRECDPTATGDLAYRAVFTRAQLEALNDERINDLCKRTHITAWLGPEKHSVFYPIRGGKEFNLVFTQPDNLPPGVRTEQGTMEEITNACKNWNSLLEKMMTSAPSVVKWKLCSLAELETWTRGRVAILGDACHPTLPYQAQGAAMAVEDAAVIGLLLGAIAKHPEKSGDLKNSIPSALQLYQDIRKGRTAQIVNGAMQNRKLFHMEDGIARRVRDLVLKRSGMTKDTDKLRLMYKKQKKVVGFDVMENAGGYLQKWV